MTNVQSPTSTVPLTGIIPNTNTEAEQTNEVAHAPQPGHGSMQGSMVDVGPGALRTQLHEDASQIVLDDDYDVSDDEFYSFDDDSDIEDDSDIDDAEFFECNDEEFFAEALAKHSKGGVDGTDAQGNVASPLTDAEAEALEESVMEPRPPMPSETGQESGKVHAQAVPRDDVLQEVEQQQGWFSYLWAGATNAVSGTANVAANIVGGTANALGAAAGKVVSLLQQPEASEAKAPPPTLQEKNLAAMDKLTGEIKDKFIKLNLQLEAMGAQAASDTPSQKLDGPELGIMDRLNRWGHQAAGMLSAAQTTVGQGAVAAAIPTVASIASPVVGLVGGPVAGIGVQAAAGLGGVWLGMSALQQFPSLANDRAALSLMNSAMADINKDLGKLDRLLAQEQTRNTAMLRTTIVSMERAQAAEAPVAKIYSSLEHFVSLSNGAQRTETLSLAGRAKSAFQSFFSTIGHALSSAGRTIADLPNIINRFIERRAAGKAELAYTEGPGKEALSALAGGGSNVTAKGADVRAMNRTVEAGGTKLPIEDVRRQLAIGENLARTLLSSAEPTFGAAVVETPSGKYPVAANLTTGRALAWYFDTLASEPPGTGGDAPNVQRDADGALLIPDPAGNVYGFLMNAPTAYTGTMAGQTEPLKPGTLTLDDFRPGFPQGGRAMQFERTFDDNGDAMVRMSFTKTQPNPVFTPLNNEKEILSNMRTALYSSSDGLRMPASAVDHVWADNEQIQQLENWQNPFMPNRA